MAESSAACTFTRKHMNSKLLLRGILLLMVGMGCAMAEAQIPNTPAGQTLRVWLDAFNSGDRGRMENFVKTVDPAWNLDGMISYRRSTGGFSLLSIERSEP